MPSTTTRLKLPYPIGSDPVADGDNAIRALADSLDAIGGGAGVAITAFAAGVVTEFEGCAVYRRGRSGFLTVACRSTIALSAGYALFAVAAEYRPERRIRAVAWNYTGSGPFLVSLDQTLGNFISEVAIPTNTTILASMAYPLPSAVPA